MIKKFISVMTQAHDPPPPVTNCHTFSNPLPPWAWHTLWMAPYSSALFMRFTAEISEIFMSKLEDLHWLCKHQPCMVARLCALVLCDGNHTCPVWFHYETIWKYGSHMSPKWESQLVSSVKLSGCSKVCWGRLKFASLIYDSVFCGCTFWCQFGGV